jgi:spore coat polysaccharide biosynthesis protein SpsF
MRRGFTLGVVQARTTSSRLPGKVLLPLLGEPMILRQLERITRASTLDLIVVATSEDESDDDLAFVIADAGYDLIRGSLDDVLARFIRVIDEYHPDTIVRMTADCPLTSPAVIDLIAHAFDASETDYASNTMIPTYPDGLDVEVVTAQALRKVAEISSDPDEREHVTLGLYRRPEQFSVVNVVDPSGLDHSDLRLTVDTPEDFAFVEVIYQRLFAANPEFEYVDVLRLLNDDPALLKAMGETSRNAALDGLDTGAMQHKSRGISS